MTSSPFMYVSPDQLMRDKAEYARRMIARGREVVALEYVDGIVFVAENPSVMLHKFSEIYDRIAFAGVGKYNEYESLRINGIQWAELTGYNYSRDDVNARALANTYSQTLGRIFTETIKPFEVEILVAQVGADGQSSEMYRVDYAGIMTDERGWVAIGGRSEELGQAIKERYQESLGLAEAIRLGVEALRTVDNRELSAPNLEVAVLDRTVGRRKFRRIEDTRVAQAIEAASAS